METIAKRETIRLEVNPKRFMPSILFVLKARSKEKNRQQLSYLNIDDAGFCCTDGKRLHFCNDKNALPKGLANGLYDVIVTSKSIAFIPVDGTFPNYQNVIPGDSENQSALFIENNSISVSLGLALLSKLLKNKYTVNYEHLIDVIDIRWSVSVNEDKPVKLTNGKMLVLIMPIRFA